MTQEKRTVRKPSTEKNIESPSVQPERPAFLTPDEQAIANRVMGEDDAFLHPIGEDSAIDFSLMEDKFRLPPPAKKEQDEKHYAFRWITRTPQRLDEVKNKEVPFRWWICNATTTPFLKDFIDYNLGCVVREDQMLVFKRWDHHMMEMKYKTAMADGRDQGQILKKDGLDREGVEYQASKRRLGEGKGNRQEVKGDDIIMGDEDAIDASLGIETKEADVSDLIAE